MLCKYCFNTSNFYPHHCNYPILRGITFIMHEDGHVIGSNDKNQRRGYFDKSLTILSGFLKYDRNYN